MHIKSFFITTLLFFCILQTTVNSYGKGVYKHNFTLTHSKTVVQTQKAKIDPNRPNYRFQISYPKNVDSDETPITIKVFSGDETTPLQVLKLKVWASVSPELKFKDANFDGFPDMMMVSDGGAKWHSYTYWLFDKDSGLFEKNALAKQMTSTISGNVIRFNKTQKTISAIHDVGPVQFDSSTYKIINKRLVLIKSIEILIKDPITEGKDNLEITTKKSLRGKLVTNTKTIEVPSSENEEEDPVRALLYKGDNKKDKIDSDADDDF